MYFQRKKNLFINTVSFEISEFYFLPFSVMLIEKFTTKTSCPSIYFYVSIYIFINIIIFFVCVFFSRKINNKGRNNCLIAPMSWFLWLYKRIKGQKKEKSEEGQLQTTLKKISGLLCNSPPAQPRPSSNRRKKHLIFFLINS